MHLEVIRLRSGKRCRENDLKDPSGRLECGSRRCQRYCMRGSRIPTHERAIDDQMVKMLPQLGWHISTHE